MKTYAHAVAPYMCTRKELLEVLSAFKDEDVVLPTGNIVAIYDTDNSVGLYRKSDIICIYDAYGEPISVTERLERKDYSFLEWWRMKRELKHKVATTPTEFDFFINVGFSRGYIDYTHYKEALSFYIKSQIENKEHKQLEDFDED